MKKLSSTLPNMVIVLTLTTVLAGFLLGLVNSVTEAPRQKVANDKRISSLQSVVAEFNNEPLAEAVKIEIAEGDSVVVYPTRIDGALTGAAIESVTHEGFSGDITLMGGFDLNGALIGYEVTKHAETPGLGSKMNEWFRGEGARNVIGLTPGTEGLKVTKDKGQVDAITAATISSRAFLDAINRAANAWNIYLTNNN